MRLKWLVWLLLAAVVGGLFWSLRSGGSPQREFVRFRLKDQEYTAVVSRQPAEITLGLSGRENIGADAMLFMLPQAQQATFWMYRMHFPLDFVWLAQGRVIDRHENIPNPPLDAAPADIPTVRPQVPAEAVLELPAGFVDAHQIQSGDEFVLTSQFFRQVW